MLDRPGHDRGFASPSPRRADEREAGRTPERSPQQAVQARFVEANKTLAAIAGTGIPKLEAAQPFEGDRRGPRQRRIEYELAKEEIASQFKSADTAKTVAIEQAKLHGVDVTALMQEFDERRTEVDKQLEEAPQAPPRFQRVPGEDAILAAILMQPGEERNIELLFRVSGLDGRSARARHGRLVATEPDSEDELAQAFQRVDQGEDLARHGPNWPDLARHPPRPSSLAPTRAVSRGLSAGTSEPSWRAPSRRCSTTRPDACRLACWRGANATGGDVARRRVCCEVASGGRDAD